MYPTLKTERVILRSFCKDDAKNVFELINAYKQQNKGDHFADIKTFADAIRINDETIKNDNEFMIIEKETLNPIGWAVCDKALGYKIYKRTFIHVWIRNEYRHIGLGREILEKLMNFCFYGIQTENVVTNVKNIEKKASQLMQNLGFEIYNHFPKTTIYNDDTTIQFKISKENYIKQPYAFIDTYNYELPKKLTSPYNYNNPIRKIDSINYIKEPTGYLCGQSVIAMLANVSVDEIISVMEHDKGAGIPMMKETLKYYGLKTATKTRVKYIEGAFLPECCILSVQLSGYGHWSLYYKGKFYDPEFGILNELPINATLVSYWEIIV